jgi:hypothetical protein
MGPAPMIRMDLMSVRLGIWLGFNLGARKKRRLALLSRGSKG